MRIYLRSEKVAVIITDVFLILLGFTFLFLILLLILI